MGESGEKVEDGWGALQEMIRYINNNNNGME
jgi:hypothetical protein